MKHVEAELSGGGGTLSLMWAWSFCFLDPDAYFSPFRLPEPSPSLPIPPSKVRSCVTQVSLGDLEKLYTFSM